jgi:hypothetical protein
MAVFNRKTLYKDIINREWGGFPFAFITFMSNYLKAATRRAVFKVNHHTKFDSKKLLCDEFLVPSKKNPDGNGAIIHG